MKTKLIIVSLLWMNSMGVALAVPNPTVSGPITCVTAVTCTRPDGLPLMSTTLLPYLAAAGYQEKEYFIEGNATAYTTTTPLTSDGQWNTIMPDSTAAYKTRILVRTPIDPKQFNGTVIVEWNNVTAGYDGDFVWMHLYTEVLRSGFAYVTVSAQKGGTDALPVFDPLRYGSLSITSDSYSYDIFSQAIEAIRDPEIIDPLEGLKVDRIIATGNSQSAARLTTYMNAIHKQDQVVDGFLISARIFGSGSSGVSQPPQADIPTPFPLHFRTDLDAPVLHVVSETDIIDNLSPINIIPFYYGGGLQPDNDTFRQWEVAGSSHLSAYQLAAIGVTPPTATPLLCAQPISDGIAMHYVMNAALNGLNEWIITGKPVATAERFSIVSATFPSPPIPDRDSYGNIKGGIRTPFVDVPLATHLGVGNTNHPSSPTSFLGCKLAGSTIPLDTATIDFLYPNHGTYVSKVTKSTNDALKKGFILRKDAKEIHKNAVSSSIGK